MEPADLRTRDYHAEHGGLNFTAIRGVAVQRTMSSRYVVVGRVAAKYPQEVSFVEHDDVVEALPTDGADQAFAVPESPPATLPPIYSSDTSSQESTRWMRSQSAHTHSASA
jgi:hypothetical protein